MKLQRIGWLLLTSLLLIAANAAFARAEPAIVPPEDAAASSGAAAPHHTPPCRRSLKRVVSELPLLDRIRDRLVLGVNPPIGWLLRLAKVQSDSSDAALAVGLTRHQAIRANISQHEGFEVLPFLLAAVNLHGAPPLGSFGDARIGWVYYPRRLWDGFMLEGGALRRARDVRESSGPSEGARIQSVMYAGRVAIGWSWPITSQLFVSTAAGVSVGWESGTRAETAFARVQVTPEVYASFEIRLRR